MNDVFLGVVLLLAGWGVTTTLVVATAPRWHDQPGYPVLYVRGTA